MAFIGAACVMSAFVVLWWGVASARMAPNALSRSLMGGRVFTDARKALLATSARDRAFTPLLENLADKARRLTPVGLIESLERRMVLAAIPPTWTVERILAVKIALGTMGVLWGLMRFIANPGPLNLLIAAGATAFGYFVVDIALYNKAVKRQAKVGQDLADTIDQITISVEAGLGLEAAIARAAKTGDGPLAEEFLRTLQDIQAGMARSGALRSLVDRTTDADLRRFVAAVVQAESYGVPIGNVLRVQTADLRVKRRQRAEEKAMKMPVKVLFPLVLCIMPAVFIVIFGPILLNFVYGSGVIGPGKTNQARGESSLGP